MTKGRPRESDGVPSKRLQKLAKIIRLLRQHDYTPQDLIKETGYPERTVYRHIEELRKLTLVTIEKGKVSWIDHKTTFQSRHDFDVAVEHSKLLVETPKDIETENEVRLDEYTPDQIFKTLYPNCDFFHRDDSYFLQHIETGFPEITTLIKKHIELNNQQTRNQKVESAIEDSYDLIVGKVVRIIDGAKKGKPLLGRCDCCPSGSFPF